MSNNRPGGAKRMIHMELILSADIGEKARTTSNGDCVEVENTSTNYSVRHRPPLNPT